MHSTLSPSRPGHRHRLAALLLTAISLGCSALGEDEDDSGSSDDDPYETPAEGLRVLPRYLLQDVPAIVTLEPGGQPRTCPPDPEVGGYLREVHDLPATSTLLRVVRDGFETALREPTIVHGSIETLEVHLAPDGGPTGIWSACAVVDAYASCDQVCAAEATSCTPAACATGDGAWPLATSQSFAAAACAGSPVESAAQSCGADLPVTGSGVESLRCCCAG